MGDPFVGVHHVRQQVFGVPVLGPASDLVRDLQEPAFPALCFQHVVQRCYDPGESVLRVEEGQALAVRVFHIRESSLAVVDASGVLHDVGQNMDVPVFIGLQCKAGGPFTLIDPASVFRLEAYGMPGDGVQVDAPFFLGVTVEAAGIRELPAFSQNRYLFAGGTVSTFQLQGGWDAGEDKIRRMEYVTSGGGVHRVGNIAGQGVGEGILRQALQRVEFPPEQTAHRSVQPGVHKRPGDHLRRLHHGGAGFLVYDLSHDLVGDPASCLSLQNSDAQIHHHPHGIDRSGGRQLVHPAVQHVASHMDDGLQSAELSAAAGDLPDPSKILRGLERLSDGFPGDDAEGNVIEHFGKVIGCLFVVPEHRFKGGVTDKIEGFAQVAGLALLHVFGPFHDLRHSEADGNCAGPIGGEHRGAKKSCSDSSGCHGCRCKRNDDCDGCHGCENLCHSAQDLLFSFLVLLHQLTGCFTIDIVSGIFIACGYTFKNLIGRRIRR